MTIRLLLALAVAAWASSASGDQKVGQHAVMQEISRKTHVEWIFSLDMAINVIDEITFIDPFEQYWQTTFKFDNTDKASRTSRVVGFTPYPTDPIPPFFLGGFINVEVVQKAKVIDTQERGQEFWYTFRDLDKPDDDNPPVHLKTHVTTIIKNTTNFPYTDDITDLDAGLQNIIAVERIDQISFIDPQHQYQETIYQLDWTDKEVENDKNLVISQDEIDRVNSEVARTGANPIIRLDPFQNIIGISTKRHIAHGHNHVAGADPDEPQSFGYTPTDGSQVFEDDPTGFFGPLSPDFNFNDPVSMDALQTWRFTFNGKEFLAGMYPSTKITLADKGQQYISHIGEAVTTRRVIYNGLEHDTDSPYGDIEAVESRTETQTGEYFAQWAVVKGTEP